MNDTPLVLYHSDCVDGFTSAWVAKRAMPNAECIPVQYGQEPPNPNDREVFILDFSYKSSTILMMTDLAKRLVCLDHHKSAQEDLKSITDLDPYPQRTHQWSINGHGIYDKLYAKFDMNKSGASLVWDYFFLSKYKPWLVRYVEDRDLWNWKLPDSKEVSAAIASYDRTFEIWDGMAHTLELEDGFNGFVREGKAILRYQEQVVTAACKNAVEIEIDGHKVLSLNTTTLISEIGNRLCQGRPFSATYFIRGDGKKVWSLRSSDDGLGVSEIAKKRNGGGHQHAAGYTE